MIKKKMLAAENPTTLFDPTFSKILTLVGEYLEPHFLENADFLEVVGNAYKSQIGKANDFHNAIDCVVGEDQTKVFETSLSDICRFTTNGLVFCTASLFILTDGNERRFVIFDHAYVTEFHEGVKSAVSEISDHMAETDAEIASVHIITLSPQFTHPRKASHHKRYLTEFNNAARQHFNIRPQIDHTQYPQNDDYEHHVMFHIRPTLPKLSHVHIFRQTAQYAF